MLDDLKRAYKKATPGDWGFDDGHLYLRTATGTSAGSVATFFDTYPEMGGGQTSNGYFTALAHNSMPTLIEAAEVLSDLLEWAERTGGWEAKVWQRAYEIERKLK